MIGLKICLYGEIWLIITKLSLLPLLVWNTVYFSKFAKDHFYNVMSAYLLRCVPLGQRSAICDEFGESDGCSFLIG